MLLNLLDGLRIALTFVFFTQPVLADQEAAIEKSLGEKLLYKLVRFAHNWNDGTMEYWPPASNAYGSERMLGLFCIALKKNYDL